jgi:predicted outer membrane repeat protein
MYQENSDGYSARSDRFAERSTSARAGPEAFAAVALGRGVGGRALLSTLTVTNSGDSGPGSLRAMAGAAAAGDVIDFSPTLNGQTITLTGGEILLTPGVSIDGPGAAVLSISGNNSSRIFEVESAETESNQTTSISGLSLLDGSALDGGAIDDAVGTGPLSVSNCYFAANVAVVQGGAIASDLPLSVYQCRFEDNSASGAASGINGGDAGQVAYGGAIWSDSSLGVALSGFYYNDAVGADGDGMDGFDADGGAIASEPLDSVAVAGLDVQASITGNEFDHNTAVGGNSPYGVHQGGNARGGALLVDASLTEATSVNVSNNMFTGNSATGGIGYSGGGAGGGSLVFGAFGSYSAQFYANHNQFNGGGAYGGASDALPETNYGQAGAANGGAVAFYADAAHSPTFTFDVNEVRGTTAQGGSASFWATGGSAAGGGVYLDADS